MNKSRKSKIRYLCLLILLFMFLISMFGLSTYAWFSSNKNTVIDTFDINVATVAGLQISVDASNWSNLITRDDIINAYKTYPTAENQIPDTFSGISTDGAVASGKFNMYYGIVSDESDGSYTLSVSKQTEKNCVGDEECVDKHYIAFDIFLLSMSPANIVIAPSSKIVPREDEVDKGSQNAARVGFVLEGTVPTDASAVSAQYLKMNDGKGKIWELNYDVHTAAGVRNAKNIYGIDTLRFGATRLPYRGINQEFSNSIDITKTDTSPYFSDVIPDIATPTVFTDNQDLVFIPAGISKIRVYCWLEGQDVDFENMASDSKIAFNLELAMAG